MKNLKILVSCCIVLNIAALFCIEKASHFRDLEEGIQDFVLETKQIIIPGFPGAFNASLVRWRDSLFLSFRVRNAAMLSTFEMGLVQLDDNFNIISEPKILAIYGNAAAFSKHQDPRLIVLRDELYIVYSSFVTIDQMVTRRMVVAKIEPCDDGFCINNPIGLLFFDGASSRWEKNWVPFCYNNNLLLAYSLIPHRIFKPLIEFGVCPTVSSSASTIDWSWGELRGGTPALLDDDRYLAFFHSSIKIATVHSQGKAMPHYVMGAYTFAAHPPFEITHISPEPIVGKNFYHGKEYKTWKPVRVVFPMGFIMDDDYIWLSYGRQDFEIWIAKLDKKGLYQSLIACSSDFTLTHDSLVNDRGDAQESAQASSGMDSEYENS